LFRDGDKARDIRDVRHVLVDLHDRDDHDVLQRVVCVRELHELLQQLVRHLLQRSLRVQRLLPLRDGDDDGDALWILLIHPLMVLLNFHFEYPQNPFHLYDDRDPHGDDGDFCPRVNHRHLNHRLLLLAQLSLLAVQLFQQLVLLETLERELMQTFSLSRS
jgi:hypothetical protein